MDDTITTVNILQWNAHSINNKLGTLCNLIDTHKIDILLLSETYLNEEKNLNINNFNVIRKDRNSRGGGVAIAIRKKFTYNKIKFNLNNSIEALGIKIKFNENLSLDITSIYIPPSAKITNTQLDAIFHSVQPPYIIAGDLNAHATDWGCVNNNPRGEMILDTLDKHLAVFINDGSFTRLQCPPLISSAIDLTIADGNTALCCDWKVLNGSYGSDHCPIITKLHVGTNIKIDTNKIIVSANKIKRFLSDENKIKNEMEKIENLQDLNKFLLDIKKKSEIIIPAKFVRTRKPWWNEECSIAQAKFIRFSKIFRKMGTRENYEKMINAEKEMKKIKKKARREGWKNYCSSISRETKITDVWKMAKIFKNAKFLTNDSHIDWMDKFIEKNSPHNPLNNLDEFLNKIKYNKPLELFTLRDVSEKIRKLKKSAAGIDGISNNLIKSLPICVIEKLTICFNEILKNCKIPDEWRECRTIAVQKPNKPLHDANSKRPISIFGKLRRIFESLLVRKIERWSENKISSSQYGFRRGKGVRDCVAVLMADIKIAFNEKKIVAAVLLDIESAYDNINIECFIKKLASLGASKNYCKLMWEMMHTKINNFEINGKIVDRKTTHLGLAQGLPSSCTAYNLATHQIELCVTKEVKILQYADDIILYCASKNIKEAEAKINESIKNIEKAIKDIGLNFSGVKSESIVFSRKHSDTKINIVVDNRNIQQKEVVRYLGITLDRKLAMTRHMNNVAALGGKSVNVMRSLTGVTWGSDPICLDLMYKGCVRSKLEFCSFVYAPNANFSKIEKIQWKACRIISGCMNSTPTNALEILTMMPPIEIRFEKLNMKFFYFIMSINCHPLKSKIQKLKNMGVYFLNFKAPRNLFINDSFPFGTKTEWKYLPMIDTQIHDIIANKKDANQKYIEVHFKDLMHSKYKNFTKIFSDASKRENSTAAAITFASIEQNFEKKFKLPNEISIFTAECFAIYASLEYAEKLSRKNICINTDSLSAIKAIENAQNTYKNHHVITKICEKTNYLITKGFRVVIVWVPSHCGVMGNERADKLANEAHENPDQVINIKLNFKEISEMRFKNTTIKKWQEIWNESEKARFCYSILPSIPKYTWYKNQPFNRKEISFWNRIISNHTRCKNSLNRFNIVKSPICECKKNYETVDHIIFECELLNNSVMKQKLRNIGYHPPWCIRDIIASEINNSEKNAMKIISNAMAKDLIEKRKI